MNEQITVITGPQGSGRSTLARELARGKVGGLVTLTLAERVLSDPFQLGSLLLGMPRCLIVECDHDLALKDWWSDVFARFRHPTMMAERKYAEPVLVATPALIVVAHTIQGERPPFIKEIRCV